MMLFIQCVVFCLLFTLIILPAQYKDPIKMIMSYPPGIRKRVEELPQYKGTIKQREKAHIGKKIFGLLFFVIVLAGIAYLSGCRSFGTTFVHVFTLFFVVNIYDMSGRVVATANPNSEDVTVMCNNGMYVVEVITDSDIYRHKVVVR
jgi:hypothetical protein